MIQGKWDPGKFAGRSKINAIFRLLRIEHTLFSLPFAYAGALIVHGMSGREFLWITLAVFALRVAAPLPQIQSPNHIHRL